MKTIILTLTILTIFTNLFGQSGRANDDIKNSLKAIFPLIEHDRLENIMQFNKDTFLISGYLSDNSIYNSPKNVVFQTFDGGKTWKKHHFNGDAWIYSTHFQKDGKVWMGGSDEYVHYSNDYGSTWTIRPKPFYPINRILSIYMVDSLNGIAGGLSNGLAITNDNWQTAKQIPTPLDQKKFSTIKNSARNRIDRIQILGSLMLINQNDHIYYSRLTHVGWKAFNIPTRDFSVDQSRKRIELFGVRNKIFVLDSSLDLLETYVEPDELFVYLPPQKEAVDINSFLAPGIRLTQLKAVKFNFDKMAGGCMPFALYKENSRALKVNNVKTFSALKNILTTCEKYNKPLVKSFKFSTQDFDDYHNYYAKIITQRQREKIWGGDFTILVDNKSKLFLNPKITTDNLNQQLLDTVYKTFASYPFSFTDNKPYIIVNVINNDSDTLKITNKNSNLFSLPWTIEYKNHSFETFDTRITELLKTTLPKGFNYYNKLLGGELIYKLIEQKAIDEMVYKNGN